MERRGTPGELNALSEGMLPGLIGVEIVTVEGPLLTSRLVIRPELLAPNGYLHAASVIALADTTCGYGTWANLPDGATGFTTIELKSNFIGTARSGELACEGTLVHAGRSTQVWDARVSASDSGNVIALFRCTQIIFSAPPGGASGAGSS